VIEFCVGAPHLAPMSIRCVSRSGWWRGSRRSISPP
jgi:hypothetical protein